MKKALLFTAFTLLIHNIGFAQDATEVKKGYKYNNNFDIALGAGSGQFSGALSWIHFHGIGKKKKFKIGYGIRFTSYFGSNQNYMTAPPELTAKPESIDTLFMTKAQVNALNVSINLQYSFSSKFEVGFNIDAVGLSFGGKQTGQFISSTLPPINELHMHNASVTPFNLLLVGDNDIGTLNSELYVRYWLSEKIGIKAGLGFLFTEFTTNNKLAFDNDRFRNKSMMGMIGITFSPFR